MRRLSPLVVGMIAAVVCARLGLWQVARLKTRQARNAVIETRIAQPPVTLPTARLPDSLPYRRATARGVFDLERQVIVQVRSLEGAPGVYLVTPLLLTDGRGVLVERGWTYSPDGRAVHLAELDEPDSLDIQGVFLPAPPATLITPLPEGAPATVPWPLRVRAADAATLSAAFPYLVLPLVLRRTDLPSGVPRGIRAIPPPELGSGPHLSYAVQWFAFAVIAAIGSVILWRKSSTDREAGSGVGKRDTGNGKREA